MSTRDMPSMTCATQTCQAQDGIHSLQGAASSAHLLLRLRDMPGAMMNSMLHTEKTPINGRTDASGALPATPELSTCLASNINTATNECISVCRQTGISCCAEP